MNYYGDHCFLKTVNILIYKRISISQNLSTTDLVLRNHIETLLETYLWVCCLFAFPIDKDYNLVFMLFQNAVGVCEHTHILVNVPSLPQESAISSISFFFFQALRGIFLFSSWWCSHDLMSVSCFPLGAVGTSIFFSFFIFSLILASNKILSRVPLISI